jgi:ribosomal protein S27E
MIERDLNDSFPESDFVTWTCPVCAKEQQVMARLLGTADCPECADTLLHDLDTGWLDSLDAEHSAIQDLDKKDVA